MIPKKTTRKIKPKPQPPTPQVYEQPLIMQTLPEFSPKQYDISRLPLTIEEYADWGSL